MPLNAAAEGDAGHDKKETCSLCHALSRGNYYWIVCVKFSIMKTK